MNSILLLCYPSASSIFFLYRSLPFVFLFLFLLVSPYVCISMYKCTYTHRETCRILQKPVWHCLSFFLQDHYCDFSQTSRLFGFIPFPAFLWPSSTCLTRVSFSMTQTCSLSFFHPVVVVFCFCMCVLCVCMHVPVLKLCFSHLSFQRLAIMWNQEFAMATYLTVWIQNRVSEPHTSFFA